MWLIRLSIGSAVLLQSNLAQRKETGLFSANTKSEKRLYEMAKAAADFAKAKQLGQGVY